MKGPSESEEVNKLKAQLRAQEAELAKAKAKSAENVAEDIRADAAAPATIVVAGAPTVPSPPTAQAVPAVQKVEVKEIGSVPAQSPVSSSLGSDKSVG